MAQEWRDDTDRLILGYCCLPLAIDTLVLAAFGSWKLLAVAIPTLVPLVFLLSLDFPCIYYDEIKSEPAHNRQTRGGVEREHVKLLHNSNCPSYQLIIHIT